MNTATRILKYTLIAMIVLLLGSASGWYVYLRSQKSPLARVADQAGGSGGFQGNRGSAPGGGVNVGGDSATSTGATPAKPIERLWRVNQGPVAGFAFVDHVPLDDAASTSPSLFFAERANGYIFGANAVTQIISRITNTLMPKTYEAHFAASGEYVLLRSVDESGALTTFASSLLTNDASTTPQALGGAFLPANIREIALDRASKNIFLLFFDSGGGSSGVTQLQDGTKSKKVFSSFVRSWLPIYAQGQLIVITKPSDAIPGYAYKVGTTGTLSLVVGGMPGLAILPHPTENALLYSSSANGNLALFVQTGKAAAIQLGLQTIADKCVWTVGKTLIIYCAVPTKIASSSFLNDWYRGALHTEDAWWKIDATSGKTELVYAPPSPLDVHSPVIDKSGAYLAFTNGSDQSLYLLRIVQ